MNSSVIKLFLKVNLSQFRIDFLVFLKKEKGEALRKKVMIKKKQRKLQSHSICSSTLNICKTIRKPLF